MPEISPHILDAIRREMTRAEEIHPNYPMDPLRQTALMCEEAGEALKAALDLTRPIGSATAYRRRLRRETVQTAVMAIKLLEALRFDDE